MKYIILLFAILLSGCITPPVKQEFPVMPDELTKTCGSLKLLEGKTVVLSKLMETVATNYELYHECAAKHDATIEWYKKQSEIFNKVNNK